ncbi:unnamed protein product [Peronospora farinosa]|uniref:RxLR effector protein n=1 Tax=Peronospora farinosa TaxID=134698 RepID=A0AAV0TTL1_9STRA|nr:unnamed protein product [Peronospora farinosa]
MRTYPLLLVAAVTLSAYADASSTRSSSTFKHPALSHQHAPQRLLRGGAETTNEERGGNPFKKFLFGKKSNDNEASSSAIERYEEAVARRHSEEYIEEVSRPAVGSPEEVMLYVREGIDENDHIKSSSLAFNSYFKWSLKENPDGYSKETLGFMANELLKLCHYDFESYLRTLRYLPTSDIHFLYSIEDMVTYALEGVALLNSMASPVFFLERFTKVTSADVFQETNFKLWVLYMKGYSSAHKTDFWQEIAFSMKQHYGLDFFKYIVQTSYHMNGEAKYFGQNLKKFL